MCGLFRKGKTKPAEHSQQNASPAARHVRDSTSYSPAVELPSSPLQAPRRRPLLTSKFIVAIDFGTTFTGVAWGHFHGSTNLDARSPNAKVLAEKIFVYKKWPGNANAYAEKTPSVISYGQHPSWGGKVKPHHKLQVARFKLGLDPEKVRDVFGLGGDGVLGLVPALDKTAVDVSADFLTHVNRHIETEALPDAFGEGFLAAQSKMYVITVPAIWSDRAKALTRQAAARAGIPKERLVLVTEPEAAALYCATAGDQVDLVKGDSFIICDAGGGTVVSDNVFCLC
jgi:molecular chaperone DnaK (HSP70)